MLKNCEDLLSLESLSKYPSDDTEVKVMDSRELRDTGVKNYKIK